MLLKSKRSQVAIFIILAIAIVAVLLILFLPGVPNIFGIAGPSVQIESCLKENLEDSLEVLSENSTFSLSPELYYNYNGEVYEYLCYTNEWYQPCVMQKPLIQNSIENEIEDILRDASITCVDRVEDNLRGDGYNVRIIGDKSVSVNILPGEVRVDLDAEINYEKDDEIKDIRFIDSGVRSEYYRLLSITTSILNWEAHYGDAAVEPYMAYYSDVKVEKHKESYGTTLYTVTHRETGEKLKFASRSMAWPPGYAV